MNLLGRVEHRLTEISRILHELMRERELCAAEAQRLRCGSSEAESAARLEHFGIKLLSPKHHTVGGSKK